MENIDGRKKSLPSPDGAFIARTASKKKPDLLTSVGATQADDSTGLYCRMKSIASFCIISPEILNFRLSI
jgi:hypothetical protein